MTIEVYHRSSRPSTARTEDNIGFLSEKIDARHSTNSHTYPWLYRSSIQLILNVDLGMQRVAAKLYPNLSPGIKDLSRNKERSN